MNRELKFRVWDEEDRRWFKGLERIMLPVLGGLYNQECDCHILSGFTIEQYTGLKDKNGVEIYEGDIIQKTASQIDFSYELFTCVIFDESGFYQKIIKGFSECQKGTIVSFPNEIGFIVGNIHENPELLEER